MTVPDRVGRCLFVGAAVGLAWGIRGDFGHVVGAMYPGAVLGLALAYVSGQRSLFLWMPTLAALAALGIGAGGTMSYGILHGYAQSDTLTNYGYGFLTLFLQGAAWGTFGGAVIGLLLERRPMRTGDWLGWGASLLFGGWVVSYILVDVLGFQINPPRNNGSVGYMGAALAQMAWLAYNRRTSGLRGAVLGYVGFGLGMSAGRLLGNLSNELQPALGFTINHWNVMETSCGFIGGAVFCWGMVDRAYPEPPEDEGHAFSSLIGMTFVLGMIPLWHRLARVGPSQKLPEWTAALKSYGRADPEGLARKVLLCVDALVVFGFVGAAVWAAVYRGRRTRWAALPVLWLSLTMLLFQNLHALYPFYPHLAHRVNMHNVFWALFAFMAIYVAVARPRPAPVTGDGAEAPFPAARWLAGGFAGLTAVVLLAGLVNGPNTMKHANTRWPAWTWKEGPFPGRVPTTPPRP